MAIFRKGDQVTLTATVKYDYRADDAGDVLVDVEGHYSTISIPVDKVTMKRPAFKIGDNVSHESQPGKIVGLSFDLAWVLINGLHYSIHIDELKYVEVEQIAEAA